MRLLINALEVRGLGILDDINEREAGQFDSGCIRQQLPSLLVRRRNADLAQLTCSLLEQRSYGLAHEFGLTSLGSRVWAHEFGLTSSSHPPWRAAAGCQRPEAP